MESDYDGPVTSEPYTPAFIKVSFMATIQSSGILHKNVLMPGLLQISLQISSGLFSVHSPALIIYTGVASERKRTRSAIA